MGSLDHLRRRLWSVLVSVLARPLMPAPELPCAFRWYKVLDKRVMPDNPRSTQAVLLKTAADQLVWAPIMTVVFFAVLKSLEGHPELIWDTVQVCACPPCWWLLSPCVPTDSGWSPAGEPASYLLRPACVL